MKLLLSIFLVFIISNISLNSETTDTIANGSFIKITIDKVLYEQTNDSQFYIHITIENKSNKKIGVKLNEDYNFIYPNQYGFMDNKNFFSPSIRGFILMSFDYSALNNLIEDYNNSSSSLMYLDKKEKIGYYTNFNLDNVRRSIENVKAKYFRLLLDGTLYFTDGKQIEVVNSGLATVNDENTNKIILAKDCDFYVFFDTPIVWKQIPEKSFIIKRK